MPALPELDWYNQQQNDEALGGADYAEEKWFGHERKKIGSRILAVSFASATAQIAAERGIPLSEMYVVGSASWRAAKVREVAEENSREAA